MARIVKKKLWLTFNRDGIGGIQIVAPNRAAALRVARGKWGRGAKVELIGTRKIFVHKN